VGKPRSAWMLGSATAATVSSTMADKVAPRAVAGELVVLVKHVQAERAVGRQCCIALKAITVSRRSMASWVICSSCT
jgi:hypothetical protein